MPKVRRGRGVSKRVSTTRKKKAEEDVVSSSGPVGVQPPGPSSAIRLTATPAYDDKVAHMLSSFKRALSAYVKSHSECKEYAPVITKYMRNQFTFFGIKAPARRALQKSFFEENIEHLKSRDAVIGLIGALWDQEERDFQGFAVDLMSQQKKSLLGESDREFSEVMAVAERCVVTKSWWDTVDAIAYQVVGYFVKQRPSLGVPIMKTWIDHDYMWLRRVAILHQVKGQWA